MIVFMLARLFLKKDARTSVCIVKFPVNSAFGAQLLDIPVAHIIQDFFLISK